MNGDLGNNMLASLGFTDEWLSRGILKIDYLEYLYNKYQESEDKNTEHYRWMTFKKYILQNNLNKDDLLNLYNIALGESDLALQYSMMHQLIEEPDIPINILRELESHNSKSIQRKASKFLGTRLNRE